MKITIEGMACQNCVKHVQEALSEIGMSNISIDLAEGIAIADGIATPEEVRSVIEETGYSVIGIEP